MTSILPRTSLFSRRTFLQEAISAVGSVRIKLLFSCCTVFVIISFSSRAPSFMGWKQSQTLYDLGRSFPSSAGYAMLINTWKRNDLLKKSISHYASCPRLSSVHIVWSEPDPPSDSLIKYLTHVIKSNSKSGREIELKFDINGEDSLNNRFKEIKDLKTDALFSIDDDVIFPCSTVELAFTIWQSASDTMVGFVPRMHWRGNHFEYTYGGWWSVWWMGTYSMVLSKAAFFHQKYLSLYTHQMPASIREYVTKNRCPWLRFLFCFCLYQMLVSLFYCSLIISEVNLSLGMARNCEDIAMSFLVANATGVPPIWVKGKIYEIGSTGISSLGGHSDRRTECVNRFVAEYGHMPLVSTSVKVVDSKSSWFW